MLDASHAAVGLIVGGSLLVLFGLLSGVREGRRAYRRFVGLEHIADSVEAALRSEIDKQWSADKTAANLFHDVPEREQVAQRVESRANAWASDVAFRVRIAADLPRGPTVAELTTDERTRRAGRERLRSTLRSVVLDLVLVGLGTVLTAAGSIVGMA